jgi:hypothetical protein
MESAPNAGRAFSPLDDELQLLPGRLCPTLHESLVRLSSWMPFAPAPRMLADLMHLPETPESLARRYTETAGAAYVQKELRKTLFKYKLHTDQDLFDRAYAYIRQYY